MKHTPKCPKCNNLGIHNETFDAYMCLECNLWLEPTCDDNDCVYCRKRPETPTKDIP
jgi:hypothetical protein